MTNGHGNGKKRAIPTRLNWFLAELTKTQTVKHRFPERSSWYWADSSRRVLSRSSCWSISFCKLLSSLWASYDHRFAHQGIAKRFSGRDTEFGIVILSVLELDRQKKGLWSNKQKRTTWDINLHELSRSEWYACTRFVWCAPVKQRPRYVISSPAE